MLPGFRFLFAAIMLSISMLIFGLGAAALLRAAHEEFASILSRRAPPETMFAQRDAGTALAMLRVDASAAADEKALSSQTSDNMQVAAPASEQSAFAPATAEWEKSATEPEQIVALPDVATLQKIRRHPKRPRRRHRHLNLRYGPRRRFRSRPPSRPPRQKSLRLPRWRRPRRTKR